MITSENALMQISLSVAPPVSVSTDRRYIPITGGLVTGAFQGKVLSGGADWQKIAADGTIEIDARYVLELVDGRVEVESRGLRSGSAEILNRLSRGEIIDPKLYYFRTAMRFWTTASRLNRLNHMLAVSCGERLADTVRLTVFEVV